mgnify:CR=1 FL=1
MVTKQTRQAVYNKYGGRCAYCGKELEYKDMQVDHIDPQRYYDDKKKADQMENLNPACRRCNHYKRGNSLGGFRRLLKTLHQRVREIYICKVAEDYGVIKVEPWDGKFYYERMPEEATEYTITQALRILAERAEVEN